MTLARRSKNIIITGASSGFGKKTVEELVMRGHRVIAALRGGDDRLKSVFDQTLLSTGLVVGCDLHMERSETFRTLLPRIDSHFEGRVDVLINNAGYGLYGPFETHTEEQLRHQFEVNFFGPLLLTRLLLPKLRESRGRIINISSVAGLSAFPFYSAYNATKHALDSFTEALHYELHPLGVDVALVEPGGFKTDFMGANLTYGKDESQLRLYSKRIAQFQKSLTEKNTKFSGNPNVVVRRIVHLTESNRVTLRSVLGKDAKMIVWIKRLLPDSLRIKLINWSFKKFIFKE